MIKYIYDTKCKGWTIHDTKYKGVVSQGLTKKEALKNLKEDIDLAIKIGFFDNLPK